MNEADSAFVKLSSEEYEEMQRFIFNSATMSGETAQEIVNQIKDKLITGHSGGFALIWYGGEPLIAWNTVRDITSILYQFCKRLGIQFDSSIVTNGDLLSANRVCELKEIGCTTIQITLDGDNASHDVRRPLKNGGVTFQFVGVMMCDTHT